MLRKTNKITGFRLRAHDGDIGLVKDFFFDDANWVIRYLVADTGPWMARKRVLISPFAVRQIGGPRDKTIEVDLTKAQIESAPTVDHDKPVSRQMEEEFYRYYNWPIYWAGPYAWGPYPVPRFYTQPPQTQPSDSFKPPAGDPHLRSADEVRGYHILALDDSFGHVEDIVFDEHDWAIRYLVVDTRNWWPGKRVLLPPDWASSVDWANSHVLVDLDRETVRRAPEYDPNTPISRNFEERLYSFFNREPYWISPRHAIMTE